MDIAFVAIPGNEPGKRIGIVELWESGYHPTDFDQADFAEDELKATVEHYNVHYGIPRDKAQAVSEAALAGSMFGWTVPGAKAAVDYFAHREGR